MDRLFPSIVAVLFAAVTFSIQPSAQAEADETFGNSANEFNIAFRPIYYVGVSGHYPFDATTDNLVPYAYRIGIDEISEDDITKATASGLIGVTAGARTGDQPAGNLRWLEAAAFVNWMNTSTGKQAALGLWMFGPPRTRGDQRREFFSTTPGATREPSTFCPTKMNGLRRSHYTQTRLGRSPIGLTRYLQVQMPAFSRCALAAGLTHKWASSARVLAQPTPFGSRSKPRLITSVFVSRVSLSPRQQRWC